MKTIYNTYVEVTSQEQADRLLSICNWNELPIWDDERAFIFEQEINVLECFGNEFYITSNNTKKTLESKIKVTEQEFIELIKTTK